MHQEEKWRPQNPNLGEAAVPWKGDLLAFLSRKMAEIVAYYEPRIPRVPFFSLLLYDAGESFACFVFLVIGRVRLQP